MDMDIQKNTLIKDINSPLLIAKLPKLDMDAELEVLEARVAFIKAEKAKEKKDDTKKMSSAHIELTRKKVKNNMDGEEIENQLKFNRGDSTATSEYIYDNQKKDSQKIITEFKKGKRVISVQKRTKVGADGLMISLAADMAFEDEPFFTDPENVRILTGMSNCDWEKGMIEKCPKCYKDKIFHHGQLSKASLKNLKNSLIIIDEIDSGDKEHQILHQTLKDSGVLDVKFMSENNIRFVFISATIIRELHELYRWGDLHSSITMSIPDSYIGHGDFLKLGIIQEFYPMKSRSNAEKWIDEDILTYGTDFRVHIARTTDKYVGNIQDACIKKEISFINHNAFERLTPNELKKIFEEPLLNHVVICVKGFYRRANLIPNKWKMRIGATHELHTKTVDNNVQVQGLPGRMSGYWREIVESGHKTGPYRTSIDAIVEYENAYLDPLGDNPYQTFGFKKNSRGKISQSTLTMLNPKHIENLVPVDLPEPEKPYEISGPFEDASLAKKWCEENLTYGSSVYGTYDEDGTKNKISGTCIKVRACLVKILNFEDTLENGDSLGWGTKVGSGTARIRPILNGDILKFKYIVSYDKTQLLLSKRIVFTKWRRWYN